MGKDINAKSSILVKKYHAKKSAHKKENENSVNVIDLDNNKKKQGSHVNLVWDLLFLFNPMIQIYPTKGI